MDVYPTGQTIHTAGLLTHKYLIVRYCVIQIFDEAIQGINVASILQEPRKSMLF